MMKMIASKFEINSNTDTPERRQEENMDAFLKVNLTMFNDANQTSGASTETSTQGSNVVNAPQPTAISSRQSPLSNVVYGKQVTDTTQTTNVESTTPNAQGADNGTEQKPNTDDRKMQYKEFKEQYKDLYGAEVEAIIKDRFKKYTGLEQQLGTFSPIVNLLMEKHQVKDPSKLYEMLQEDVYESIADRDGLTVEQVKEIQTLKAENERLRQQTSSVEQETAMNQRIAVWQQEANNLKAEYPDFDIDSWAGNEQFMNLLFAGVSVKSAYEVCNLSGIKANVAKQMEKNVVANIQAKGKPVKENGTNPTAGITIKSSVGDLTREDRAEIARRAMRGEKITF